MPDITYSVVVDLGTKGTLASPFSEVHSKASAIDSIVSKMGDGLSGVVDKIESAVTGFAKMAGAAGLGLAIYGVAKLNNSLEQTKLSMAAIFTAQGFTKDFADGMGLAGEQLAKMKQDVKTLPGDLGQLSDIMKTIATPAAQGGADPDVIRKLAGSGMLVGKILGVQQEVVSRELANLLSGRAGAHNILGLRMGLTGDAAKEFNAKTASGRLADIQQRFQSYAPAAEAFSHSFVANWTTLLDNVKYTILAPGTSPLFESVKKTIIEINDYFDKHAAQIDSVVDRVGNKLAAAWDVVLEKVKSVMPLVEAIGGHLLNMSGADFESMGAKFFAGGLAAKLAPSVLGGGAQLIAKGTEAAGPWGTLAGAGTMAAMAGVLVIVSGAVSAVTDKLSHFHETASKLWSDIEQRGTVIFEKLGDTVEKLWPIIEGLGVQFLDVVDKMMPFIQALATIADKLATAIAPLAKYLPGYKETTAGAPFTELKPMPVEIRDWLPRNYKPLNGAGGGGGGTNIQKVEIVVASNQDPSQIARVVEARLSELSRHPRASRMVNNWSSART